MKNNLKRIDTILVFLSICSLSCFYSCSNREIEMEITKKESCLNLIAPSGEKIADNITCLKNETSVIVAEVYGIDKAFEIIKLDYLPTKKGYVVFVEYKTEDDLIDSYILSKNANINYSSSSVIFKYSNSRLKSGTEGERSGASKFVCKANGNCPSNRYIPAGSYDPNTGASTVTCGCDECEMEITVY